MTFVSFFLHHFFFFHFFLCSSSSSSSSFELLKKWPKELKTYCTRSHITILIVKTIQKRISSQHISHTHLKSQNTPHHSIVQNTTLEYTAGWRFRCCPVRAFAVGGTPAVPFPCPSPSFFSPRSPCFTLVPPPPPRRRRRFYRSG